jgi:ABC-type lipoprotein release transport system permease subunit
MLGTWVNRSLRFYGARHLVFAGTVALTSAILCAVLLTGESLEAGLRLGLRERLGQVRTAVVLTEGVFPASLVERLPDAQAVLLLKGELLSAAGAVCADKAQIIGVADNDVSGGSRGRSPSSRRSDDGASSRDAPHMTHDPQEGGSAALNARGRSVLSDAEGAVRFEKPSLYSVEMPLGTAKEARLVRRAVRLTDECRQSAVCTRQSENGRLLPADFALRAASAPPVNAFLPLGALSEAAGVPGMANLLVSGAAPESFERALAEALTPEDAGLLLEAGGRRSEVGDRESAIGSRQSGVGSPETIVKSRRVFLPPGVGEALSAKGLKAEWATFHLADAFEAGTVGSRQEQSAVGDEAARSTPYGFVAAVTPGSLGLPGDMREDEVVISAWLAEALGVSTNGRLTLRWRRFEAGGLLVADSRAFRVRGVLPTETAALAKQAMPVFPGLEGVDSCAAWDVGLPMDEEKLKDPANEAYWKQWRETPKAFLTFAAGESCFGTAFGGAMSARVAAGEGAVREALRELTPAQLGFDVRPVWEDGLKSAVGSTDFKRLFAGMAFVLMVAALLLSALSLSLSLETRKGEIALFSALGWSRGKVVRVLAAEGCVPLAAGALAGGGLGALLARALAWSLGRFWSGAFAGASLGFHFSWVVAGEAAAVSVALTLGVLLWTVWRFARCSPVELWQGAGRDDSSVPVRVGPCRSVPWESLVGGALALAACAVMALTPAGAAANGAFFGGGFLLMISLLLFVKTAGKAWRDPEVRGRRSEVGRVFITSPLAAGVCRAVQAPRRSAPVVILLAVGMFLTIGILSMKHDPAAGCERPSSGSGGFASMVTSVTPFDRERGLELARRASGAKGVVPVRVHEGDEAGCLNMNQPVRPRVLGLDARTLARARAFEPADSGGIWTLLERPLEDGAIPALAADQSMLQYSLKAKADVRDGTVYAYSGPGGGTVRLRVVGALPVRSGILQGSLLVDESLFVKAFPEAGYRLWLCDYAPYLLREAAEAGSRRSEGTGPTSDLRPPISVSRLRHPEPGVTVETVEERLRLLGSVESAYLDMFLVLGGLGVVLGVFGVALVILRGVQERRGELALLSAVGLPRGTVMRLLMAEYGALVLAGLVVGGVPALVAIQPAARSLQGELPWQAMAGILAALLGSAAVCVVLAARAASRRYGPEVLKEEV